MPRYVILLHETPAGYERPTHWDLMLECDGVLVTWALAAEPASGRTMAAEKLADHRLAYLDYEGPISGGRGSVSRFDAGAYSAINIEPRRWVVTLLGGRLNGKLFVTGGAENEPRWTASFE